MDEEQWATRFRAAQERAIVAWAAFLECYATGQKGGGTRAYRDAAAELVALVQEGGGLIDPEPEILFCQAVGSLRAADCWKNPPRSDIPGLPPFLRQKKPLAITEDMLRAPQERIARATKHRLAAACHRAICILKSIDP